MSLDVVDLRGFYASPLGRVTSALLGRSIRARWPELTGLALVGMGYAIPYLADIRERTERTLAFMPARQGVVNWPVTGLSASALVEGEELPLRDSAVDRMLLVHMLEVAESPAALLSEIWRVLAPGGRLLVVAPTRRGLWARMDTTPFGQGQPFSRGQIVRLMREALFTPLHWGEALYVPPMQKRVFLSTALAWERIGGALALPFAGVHVIEASKQLYRPIVARKALRVRLAPAPVLLPTTP